MFPFAHLQIPLEEILRATNNFSDANFIRLDGFGKEYKGQLLRSGQLVDIVARKLDRTSAGQKEFWMEVSMLSVLKHENLVCIIGFCDENGEMIVVNSHEGTRGSLHQYLKGPTLTWMRRLQICVGVAHALSYIHYDKRREFSVIHCDIKSSKILLDDQWKAKLSGFELSFTQTATRRDRLCVTDVHGTIGYCDPTCAKSATVSHKSDIYSFGVVLFEVLCGREAVTVAKGSLALSARSHYEGGRLEDLIYPVLWKQMDTKSFKIFSETAYYCLKEQRSQRPNIYQVVINLEQALKSQQEYENPLMSNAPPIVHGTTSKSLKGKELQHLKIPLNDIELATENFAKAYLIGSGGYGEVYKAELDHFDSEKILPINEKNRGEVPKKRSTVAIKRIKIREDLQGKVGFLAEIEMLTSCKHPNIVSLHGFCEEGGHMILVYEHAFNGSLDGYLGSTSKLTNLTWVQRLNICIDIARGLNYLHTKLEDEGRIIHRDIKSDNILLGDNWQAKIADFGLSIFRPKNQQMNNTLYTENIAGTELYLDPEYVKSGKLKNESDIYSFGVVLFEILSGRSAYDPIYTNENSNGIAAVARRRFLEGTIREMVDPRLMEEIHENIFTLNRGPDQDSLKAFTKIAYRCVAESQAERPPAEDIIKKLEEALFFQDNIKEQFKFSFADIELATQNFSLNNLIGDGGFGKVYKGEVKYGNGRNTIAAKRLDTRYSQGEKEFLTELQVLLEYKHENLIGFVGYCDDVSEKIIVYEYAPRGSLDKYLDDSSLTWLKRLQICIDIARGLDFLHGGALTQEVVIHRDVKSFNVLLTDDWRAKLSDFGLSLISRINKDMEFVIENIAGTYSYVDPVYVKVGFLTQESDIYSLGVVLLEILCGRLSFAGGKDSRTLPVLVKHKVKKGKLDKMVFEGIRKQIAPQSLTTFGSIALQCLHDKREERPTSREVLLHLKEALEFQEDYEIWEPKLPSDYEEIFEMSNHIETYSSEKKRDLCNLLSKGILLRLQQGKVLLSQSINGERNVMTSAKMFSYINGCLHRWRSVPNSRFGVVAEILDITNLKMYIKIKSRFLPPDDVVYGVYLVFKFCDPRKVSRKPLYVNLKYRNGSKTSHAYFATWRDDSWMMIELCRFLNDEYVVFKFVLESFSRYYCGDTAIHVEGIEFRPIDNMKHDEPKKKKEFLQVLRAYGNVDIRQPIDGDGKLFFLDQVKGKKYLLLSAKAAFYNNTNVKLFKTIPALQSRFPNVIEVLSQQKDITGCIVPCVKVRDLLHRKKKEDGIIYFRSPSPWNLHDTNQAPIRRVDGWMEVKVWKFNSHHQLKIDYVTVNLKLICYEGTMCGLILRGLEFRPT